MKKLRYIFRSIKSEQHDGNPAVVLSNPPAVFVSSATREEIFDEDAEFL